MKLSAILPTFTILLILTVVLASFLPIGGQAAVIFDQVTDIAIALLFFLHGAKLDRQSIIQGLTHWRLHLVVLGTTFVFFPILVYLLGPVLIPYLGDKFYIGFVYLSFLPSTVQSSIAFTSIAKGNVPASICSASASSILGVIITPILVALFVTNNNTGLPPINFGGIAKIFLMLLLPFFVGHLLRPWLLNFLKAHPRIVKIVDQGSVLMVVYSAFSQEVREGLWQNTPSATLWGLLIACAVILTIAFLFTYLAGRLLGFSVPDRISILFCGSKKSLANGLPMAKVLFPASAMGPIILPIMVFHQIQLMVCAWIAEVLSRRKTADQ